MEIFDHNNVAASEEFGEIHHCDSNNDVMINEATGTHHYYKPDDFDLLVEEKVKGATWLNSKLKKEIELSCPGKDDIDLNDGKRNVRRLSEECNKIFAPGRQFCCKYQLHAMLEAFACSWAFTIATSGQKFKCSFGAPDKGSIGGDNSKSSPSKRRRTISSLKESIKCPFAIHFTFLLRECPVGTTKEKALVKITANCNLIHSCNPNPAVHRLALQKSGRQQPILDEVKDILELLRFGEIPNSTLRQLLKHRLLITNTSLDDQFLRNFKSRARLYILDPNRKWKSEDISSLLEGRDLAANEMTKFDSDIILTNYRAHLVSVMQDTGQMWDVINLLSRCDEVDFRISRDIDTGRPNGIVWITSAMKKRLIRYGRLLFLDFQKRQYNKVNWPYLGPVVIDSDMQIAVIAESLFVCECLDGYYFVLKSLFEMVPEFDKKRIRLIFADEFVTDELLERLGITCTATLRCDHWHLLNDVWPKYFGAHWDKVKPAMKVMLQDRSKERFEEAFESACDAVQIYPKLVDYITKFHDRPDKYAFYYLSDIEGNLERCGSTPAEENHSSVVSHLGKGASMPLPEQITQLLIRQQHLSQKKSKACLEYAVHCSTYKSSMDSAKDRESDLIAKQNLSMWAYNNLWLPVQKAAIYIDTKCGEGGDFLYTLPC